MTSAVAATPLRVLSSPGGRVQARLQAHGALERLRCGALDVGLFPASALEAGLANLWLRMRGDDGRLQPVPLLGPDAPGRLHTVGAAGAPGSRTWQQGDWQGLHYSVELVPAAGADAWFWHVQLANTGAAPRRLDLVYLQDVALAPWDALRLNEAYVSQYLDHQPLRDPRHGVVLATRQNQPVGGRVPWLLSGSLGRADAYATDALQLLGRAARAGQRAGLLDQPLPGQRLQHEHAVVALQEAAFSLAPGETTRRGFFGWLEADHTAASSAADLDRLDRVLALPEAAAPPPLPAAGDVAPADPRSLFSSCPPLACTTPDAAQLQGWFGDGWRHAETADADGAPLSFFQGDGADSAAHVVSRAKELQVLRPHGHILRSGCRWTPDEQALASTVWMAGVFHSSLTQGHASANRLLSGQRGYLGVFRAVGLRLFVDAGDGWQLLDLPSAFRMTPASATWVYQAGAHRLHLVADAAADTPAVSLQLQVQDGAPLAVLAALHLPFNHADAADDGLSPAPVICDAGGSATVPDLRLRPAPGGAMAPRFGAGAGLRLQASAGGRPLAVHDDAALFVDGRSRGLPWLCLQADGVQVLDLRLGGELVDAPAADAPPVLRADVQPPPPQWTLPPAAAAGEAGHGLAQLADWLPWLAHNALVHYLVPRGLEQFSGGGWGTRDVCQGPAELLLALGRHDALRDLLCRVFSAQNPDGDWPQWFMFYPRDAHIRAGDSHGDIVFWPLVALADYLVATGDGALLDAALPFHGDAATAPLSEHLARALAVVRRRTIAGTRLAAYGHGDWNDALQPADPAMREHLCSAWTVTLHHRMLQGLAAAWRHLGRDAEADAALADARAVADDFQRLLIADGVLAGYAAFDQPGAPQLLLHPRDATTGIHHSALAMVHAIADELFTPAQAQAHAALIERELLGPDGLRLFDRPLRYTGGPMTLFQRGESASYFGREIGLMYMHAHLRWAEALARLGRGDALLQALRLANPIGLQAVLPQAAPRQQNCYYSSSDAAFADRAAASAQYGRIADGTVALEGGWRIYSSGAGIAYRLVVQHLLGLVQQRHRLRFDPVLPPALDGLEVQLPLYGHPVRVVYRVGPRGHGPTAVLLDGQPLLLRPDHNRYRAPGMWTAAAPLRQRLAQGAGTLTIRLG